MTDVKPNSNENSSSSDDNSGNNKLIVNYLPQSMSQEEVKSLFGAIGQVQLCKLMRHKPTGQSLGYAFVNYASSEDAHRAISSLNGLLIQGKTLKVSQARPSDESIKNTNLYVSGLPKTITQQEFDNAFRPYGTIITSKLVIDNVTGGLKGIGFVRFDRKHEAEHAIEETNGKVLFPGHSEIVQVKFANQPANNSTQKTMEMQLTQAAQALLPALGVMPSISIAEAVAAASQAWKKGGGPIHHATQAGRFRYSPMTGMPTIPSSSGTNDFAQYMTAAALTQPLQQIVSSPYDKAGYSVFIYNLPPDAEDSILWRLFGPFGAVLSVRVIKDISTSKCKGYGFVTMPNYEEAATAISMLNGTQLGERTLKVSFKT